MCFLNSDLIYCSTPRKKIPNPFYLFKRIFVAMLSLQNSNHVVSKRFVCVWENVIFNKTSPSCSIASGDCRHRKHSLKKNRCGWILVGCILLRTDQYILPKCVKPENREVTNTGSEGTVFIFKNFLFLKMMIFCQTQIPTSTTYPRQTLTLIICVDIKESSSLPTPLWGGGVNLRFFNLAQADGETSGQHLCQLLAIWL